MRALGLASAQGDGEGEPRTCLPERHIFTEVQRELSNTLRTDSSPTDPRDISGHRKTLGPGTIHQCHGNRLHSCSSAASRVQRRGMVSPSPVKHHGSGICFPPYQHSSKDPCGKQFSTTPEDNIFHKEGQGFLSWPKYAPFLIE